MPSKIVKLAALILPFAVLGVMTGHNIMQRHGTDPAWQVKIAAYDPRDLLYGHYLRYRYEWNYREFATPAVTSRCLLLSPSGMDHKDPYVQTVDCDSAASGGNSVIEMPNPENRYLIPEEKAEDLDRLFRGSDHTFRVELVAHGDRSISTRNLYVDDTPLEEFLRNWTPDEEMVR